LSNLKPRPKSGLFYFAGTNTLKAEPDIESARRIVKNLKRFSPDITIDDVIPPE